MRSAKCQVLNLPCYNNSFPLTPMKCLFCGFANDKVVDSRESKEADSIRRRRECLKCEKRFTTYERIDEIPYMVVKKDGRREKFDRQKVLNGLLRACEKRPVPISKLEQIVNEAEGFVIESAERERKTSEVGELIMNRLRRYDKVAYVRFKSVYLDFIAVQEYIPKEVTQSIERTHVALKGPITTPVGGGFASINVQLRKQFELYANFRPVRNLPHIPTRYPDVDLVIVRENTESLYSGLEHEVVPGVVESLKIITEKASTRISRFAFEYARKNKRKKVHAIHKANIMKLSDGLFLRCSRNVSKEYPEITYGEHIVDNTCMQLVMNPYQYDVLVMENLYGDIISDLCAAFVGGLGFVPSANLGDRCAIFEAVHGSAPDIAGKGLANPTAVLQSAILMLRHLKEHEAATQIRNALENVYR